MKVSGHTIARTAVLFVALLNQVLTIIGFNPIPTGDKGVYEAVSVIFTAAASILVWWKNNSFTKEALEADELMKEMKGE